MTNGQKYFASQKQAYVVKVKPISFLVPYMLSDDI